MEKRIAIVTSIHPDFDPRIWKHASSLAARGWKVHLVCPWAVQDGETRSGVQFHVFPRVESRMLRPFLVPCRVMRALLRLPKTIQIVHFHDIDLVPLMGSVSFWRPVIYDIHENYAEEMLVRAWIPQSLRKILYHVVRVVHRLFVPLFRGVVAVVPYQQNALGFYRKPIVLIPNYASEHFIQRGAGTSTSAEPCVIYSGGHYIENGSMLLLDIAEACKQRKLAVQFLVTDRFVLDEYRREYERQVERRGLDLFKITPRVPSQEMGRLLSRGTIGILPSLDALKMQISLPTRLFEFMAAGLPVVASRVGPQTGIIAEAQCGLLVDPGDPQEFADAIERLTRNKEFAAKCARNGRDAFLRKYTWESQMAKLEVFYADILQSAFAEPKPTYSK
jgi:glycosyltransferase involved in cell wall biosynthesis